MQITNNILQTQQPQPDDDLDTNVPERLSEIKARSKGIKKDYESRSQKSASSNRSMKKEVRQKRIGTVERKKEEPCEGEMTP